MTWRIRAARLEERVGHFQPPVILTGYPSQSCQVLMLQVHHTGPRSPMKAALHVHRRFQRHRYVLRGPWRCIAVAERIPMRLLAALPLDRASNSCCLLRPNPTVRRRMKFPHAPFRLMESERRRRARFHTLTLISQGINITR